MPKIKTTIRKVIDNCKVSSCEACQENQATLSAILKEEKPGVENENVIIAKLFYFILIIKPRHP